MPLPASRARTVFRACVVNAVKEGEALMEQLIHVTQGALANDEAVVRNIQQRNLISDALRLLNQHQAALVKGYPMALLEIFAEGPSAAAAKARPAEDAGMDFGELSLMDESEVLAQVELSRAQQIALHATDATLAELNTLVSSAQGLRSVQPERNPFRPENYIRALQQVVGDTGVPTDVRQLWMQHMRELLGSQLVGAYKRAAQSLREHGVEPVGYAVAGAVGAGRSAYGGGYVGGQGGGYPSSYGGPASEYGHPSAYGRGGYATGWNGAATGGVPLAPEAEEALLTVGILRQMLAGGGDPYAFDPGRAGYAAVPVMPQPAGPGVPVAAAPYSAEAVAAAEAMEDMAQLERLVGRLSSSQSGALSGWNAVSTPGAVAYAPAPAAQAPTRTATEVVSRMMENIAQDTRLLAPVQRAVQNLEPALKQLVRHDARFFTDEQHPARRLLDELTQRSLAFGAEDTPGFSRFMRLVNEAVGHLSTVEIKDDAPFATVLKALEKAWDAQEKKQREQREAEEKALLQAERRAMLGARIAADIRRMPDAGKVPVDLLEFVTGPWADVVALAQMDLPEGSDDDPGGYLALVPLLFWCAQPELLRAEPDRLGQEIASMLPVVRQGLESIGHPEDKIARMLERLVSLHQAALAEAAAAPAADEAEPVAESPETLQPEAWPDLTQEMEEPEPSVAQPLAEPVEQDYVIGQWIEITTHQRAVRTQLTWASPHGTLFLFTAPDNSTQSMTRRMRDKLMAEGSLRVLSAQEVAGGAPRAPRGKSGKTGKPGKTR